MLATLLIHVHIPGCASLKEKRGIIKPFMARLQREYNLSVAELGYHDHWQQALIGCAMIGNDRVYLEASLQTVIRWVEAHWTDGDVIDQTMELIP